MACIPINNCIILLVIGVSSLMINKVSQGSERFVANITSEWSFSSMSTHVNLQVTFLNEDSTTILIGTHMVI
jgi:hypothetical protein